MNTLLLPAMDLLTLLLLRRSSVLRKYALLQKENQILRRRLEQNGYKIRFTHRDRLFIARLTAMDRRLLKKLTIISPQTVIKVWQKQMKRRWKYPLKHQRPGRPRISGAVRNLVLEIKQKNSFWGYDRIAGELNNLNIAISRDSVRRIIQAGRKEGDLLPTGSWKQFLSRHWDSLFACDFMTVETLFGYRFYVFFLMRLKDRKILQFGITRYPTMEFLKNQFRAFRYNHEEEVYLIHDNSGEFRHFAYEQFDIKGVSITPYSPNLNAYIERFNRSIRQECLDHFIILNYKHLRNLVKGYVNYYNSVRPHQGIDNRIPDDPEMNKTGKIKSRPVLFGLQHQFYRAA